MMRVGIFVNKIVSSMLIAKKNTYTHFLFHQTKLIWIMG